MLLSGSSPGDLLDAIGGTPTVELRRLAPTPGVRSSGAVHPIHAK